MLLRQFERHTFDAQDLSPQSVVIDLGANVGGFAHGIVQQFGCRCLAVEANPQLCRKIRPDPRLTVYNLAVAEKSGRLPFYVADNPEASSLLTGAAAGAQARIEVESIRLDELVQRESLERVDLIKFDIEGAEIQVLDSCSDAFLQSIPQLTVEFHDLVGITPRATVERVVARLQDLGFYTIKMSRSAWGDTLFINRRLTSASPLQLMWARHVTRNWWGLKRILARARRQ